jgi:hypothetical protein
LAFAFLAASAASLAASCRDVVSGDAENVLTKLCDTLEPCYGGDPSVIDCADLDARWKTASAETANDFLALVGSTDCFDTCPHALGCTDHAPFCLESGECKGRSECCGWSTGERDCLASSASASTTCCAVDGRACDPANDTCCNSNCRADASGDYYCGGSACTDVGEQCDSNFDCCTHRCVDQKCQKLSECSNQDEPCKTDADCCQDDAAADASATVLSCEGGVCRPPESCGDGAPCDPSDSCCGAEQTCWPLADGGVCGRPDCFPLDADCESDRDCCYPNVCDYASSPHCALAPNPVDGCAVAGDGCEGDASCCSGKCGADGVCREYAEAPCGALVVCHDGCVAGAPMDATCAAELPAQASCIEAVVMADPVCACSVWDAYCIEELVAIGCSCP